MHLLINTENTKGKSEGGYKNFPVFKESIAGALLTVKTGATKS